MLNLKIFILVHIKYLIYVNFFHNVSNVYNIQPVFLHSMEDIKTPELMVSCFNNFL